MWGLLALFATLNFLCLCVPNSSVWHLQIRLRGPPVLQTFFEASIWSCAAEWGVQTLGFRINCDTKRPEIFVSRWRMAVENLPSFNGVPPLKWTFVGMKMSVRMLGPRWRLTLSLRLLAGLWAGDPSCTVGRRRRRLLLSNHRPRFPPVAVEKQNLNHLLYGRPQQSIKSSLAHTQLYFYLCEDLQRNILETPNWPWTWPLNLKRQVKCELSKRNGHFAG